MNLLYLFFLLGLLFNVAVLTAWLAPWFAGPAGRPLSSILALPLVAYVVIFSFLGQSNLVLVAEDLFSGASYRYDQEMRQRYVRLGGDVSVHLEPPMRDLPRSLAFPDLDCDRDGWISRCYADYFGKQAVVLDSCR